MSNYILERERITQRIAVILYFIVYVAFWVVFVCAAYPKTIPFVSMDTGKIPVFPNVAFSCEVLFNDLCFNRPIATYIIEDTNYSPSKPTYLDMGQTKIDVIISCGNRIYSSYGTEKICTWFPCPLGLPVSCSDDLVEKLWLQKRDRENK